MILPVLPQTSKLKTSKLQTSKLQTSISRSFKSLSLILILSLTFPAQDALAQSKNNTNWTDVFFRMFSRKREKGGTRSQRSFCAITPVDLKPLEKTPQPAALLPKRYLGPMLSEKPLIVWSGNVYKIEIKALNNSDQKTWTKEIDPSKISPDQFGLSKLQYDGEPLLPAQDYELTFQSSSNISAPLSRHRFRTLTQVDRHLINLRLKRMATSSTPLTEWSLQVTPDSSEVLLSQVEFLMRQNLVNDAQVLILQHPNPTPELKAELESLQNSCTPKTESRSPAL